MVTVRIDYHPRGLFEVYLTRVPARDEIIVFAEPEKHRSVHSVRVVAVYHYDSVTGRGAHARVVVVEARE